MADTHVGLYRHSLHWLPARTGHLQLVSKEIPIHSAAERDEVAREAQILSSVSHPNVIQFYSLHRAGAKMSILMEYANDGDVEQKLMQRKRRQLFLPKTVICQWVVQLFQALHYLHDRGFIHRDVKTANLFLTLEGYLKLGDFGVAKLLERNSTSIASRTAATPVGREPVPPVDTHTARAILAVPTRITVLANSLTSRSPLV